MPKELLLLLVLHGLETVRYQVATCICKDRFFLANPVAALSIPRLFQLSYTKPKFISNWSFKYFALTIPIFMKKRKSSHCNLSIIIVHFFKF